MSKSKKTKEKTEKKSRKRLSVNSLVTNDKFMLAISFVIAFFIWVFMSINNGETVNYPVTDIPVTMELSEDAKNSDLSVVTVDGKPVDDFTATVRVKGNSVTVGSLRSSDIQVYGANLGNIVASGTYTIPLMARQLGVKNNYEIVSVLPSEVTIIVDKNVTTELTIESQINATSPLEYYIGAPTLSQQTVILSGPEQSVSKAVKAVVSTDVEKELEETTVLTGLKITLLDADGNEIDDEAISMSPLTVDATIPVLVKKTVPVTLSYSNSPAGFNGDGLITIEPSEIEIAAAADVIDSVESITAGTLDLSTLSYGMSPLTYSLVMPEGVRNYSGIDSATVSFDFTGYSTKSFTITNFTYLNVPEGLAAESSAYGSLRVRVIGPKSEVAELTADSISASIDLTGAKIGVSVLPVDVSIDRQTDCWIFGTYTTNVTVKNESDVSSAAASSN